MAQAGPHSPSQSQRSKPRGEVQDGVADALRQMQVEVIRGERGWGWGGSLKS